MTALVQPDLSRPGVDTATEGTHRLRASRWFPVLVPVAVLLGWQLIATALAGQHLIAAPTGIVEALVEDRHLWPITVVATVAPAMTGWLTGTGTGALLAAVAILLPAAERPVLRVAAATYGLPLVAIAPILQVTLPGDGPSAGLATLAVLFTTTVVLLRGLQAVPSAVLDVSRGLGGSRRRILVAVRVRAALPMLVTGVRATWPAALTGALVGEFLGGSSGLGAYLVQQAALLDTAKAWAGATVTTGVALLGVVLGGFAARFLGDDHVSGAGNVAPQPGSVSTRLASAAVTAVVAGCVLCVLWTGYLWLFDVSAFIARHPPDVVAYLWQGPGRGELFSALWVTLGDVAAGLGTGWLGGIGAAVALCSSRTAERVLLPVAVGAAAVPVITVIPLLTMMVGHGPAGVAVVVAIIVFFPTLILVLDRLRSVPADLLAVAASYAASPAAVLLRIRLPHAAPAVAAGLRIGCPAAVFGALIAEWLASGRGLGHLMVIDSTQYDYDRLWAAAAVMTAVAVVAFALADAAERAVLARFDTSDR